MDGWTISGRGVSKRELILSFGVEGRTDVGPREGNRGGDNGQENVPHVSRRTSVRVAKECAEQQGNAAKRQNKRWTRERGGGGETDGCCDLTFPLHTLSHHKITPLKFRIISPMVTRARDTIAKVTFTPRLSNRGTASVRNQRSPVDPQQPGWRGAKGI